MAQPHALQQSLLPFPPQLIEDSASNQGSSLAGDYLFDQDSHSELGRGTPSNADSLLEDSDGDDEAEPAITLSDLTRLRAMNLCDSPAQARTQAVEQTQDACSRNGSGLDGAASRTGSIARSNMYNPRVSRLPKSTKVVKLVGEGAANAVFELKVPPSSGVSADFQGKLLRVAKVRALGYGSTTSYYFHQQEFFLNDIQPHLGEYAVHQELVILPKSIIVELNALLQEIDLSRRPKFRGSFIGLARWGFLVEDMRPQWSNSVLIEFKPKWLLQSPSAPKAAIRCRQCALELRNYLNNPGTKVPCPEGKPCPLALGNPDSPSQVNSPSRIVPSKMASLRADPRIQAALEEIVNHKSIEVLRACQKSLDEVGPMNADPTDLNFVIAMTLRDCTCFALLPEDGNGSIKVRFGDFDWKDPKAKFGHWRGTEQNLIDGGFYTADWIVCRDTYYHPPSICLLEWPSSKRSGRPTVLLMKDRNSEETETDQTAALTSFLEQNSTVFTHQTDLEALERGLETFKREPTGTPVDSVLNPMRSDP